MKYAACLVALLSTLTSAQPSAVRDASAPLRRLHGSAPGITQQELPLKILATTPSGLLTTAMDTVVAVEGTQALSVIFSRPLIPFGADFDNSTAAAAPFLLTPPVDGHFRWVTTYIARFDPATAWQPDLRLNLTWAQNLTTWDGVPWDSEQAADTKVRWLHPDATGSTGKLDSSVEAHALLPCITCMCDSRSCFAPVDVKVCIHKG